MKMNNDNLKALLQRFVDEASADAMAEDIRKADALMDRYPSPALGGEAVERIQGRVAAACAAHRRRRIVFGGAGFAAAAAALVIVLFGSRGAYPPAVQPESMPIVSAPVPAPVRELPAVSLNLWDDAFETGVDDSYAAIREELDNISASIEAVKVIHRIPAQDFPADRYFYRDDVESRDTLLITTDFWKG